ncbi:MAG: Bax inhibitor-1 family protein, partial [Candidatus Obscuribacterales bacterium]|nr:Bax inhibitor-1 family protein [Candidatus Obscuribacterales bacterium]
ERLGWRTVAGAFLGTGGVMAVCGAVGALSGIDFSFLGGILFFGLLGLIVVGFVTIFWRLSRLGSMIEAGFGMLIFSGYFIFDFFRLAKSVNTWEAAIQLSMNLYLDYINFLLYVLQFLDAAKNHS